ncbi:MAG: hypothetical protein ACRC0L_07875 [Angustibacter sp.]
MTGSPWITPKTTSQTRRRWVEEAVHSISLEGLELSAAGQFDAAEYVAGRISLAEMGRRARARYGVLEVGGQSVNEPGHHG